MVGLARPVIALQAVAGALHPQAVEQQVVADALVQLRRRAPMGHCSAHTVYESTHCNTLQHLNHKPCNTINTLQHTLQKRAHMCHCPPHTHSHTVHRTQSSFCRDGTVAPHTHAYTHTWTLCNTAHQRTVSIAHCLIVPQRRNQFATHTHTHAHGKTLARKGHFAGSQGELHVTARDRVEKRSRLEHDY